MSIYAGIIELGDIRSAIDQLKELIQIGRHGLYGVERRRNKTEIPMVKQAKPSEILKMVNAYDAKRRLLDAMIQEANHVIEVELREV